MKKTISYIAILAMILTLFAVPVYAAPKAPPLTTRVLDTVGESINPADDFAADLLAGQNNDVGDLFISATGAPNQYEVRYLIEKEGCYLGQVHFEAINNTDELFIYSKGGLVPGKLTVNETFDMPTIDSETGILSGGTTEYSFLYTSEEEVTSFAAHAVVCCANVVQGEDVWVDTGLEPQEGYISSGAVTGQAVEVREPFGYPDPTLPYTSVWDAEFNKSPDFAAKLLASGAEFIWNYELSSGLTGTPVPTSNDLTLYGDVLKVDVDVNVPTNAENIAATLYIVADNGYIAKIGNTLINSSGFNVVPYAALTPEVETATEEDALLLEVFNTLRSHDGEIAFFQEGVVPTDAWKGMIAVGSPVPLVAGSNTINIAAMNEHMVGGNDNNNPAGVIFFIEYSWDVPTGYWQDHFDLSFCCETAWGEGEPVNVEDEGGNWSMIITEVPTHECTVDLINGSFEDPALTSSWGVFDSVPGWDVAWMGEHNDAYEIPNIEYQNIIEADDGEQYAELDSYGPISISQDINTCIHHNYVISFAWSPRDGAECAMEVWWNGDVIGTYSGNVSGWTTVEIGDLVPDSDGVSTLVFRETGTFNQLGMFLDDVTIDFD